jgi:hypothetical protein
MTVRVTEDIAIDFGPGEELVGIEILRASEQLGLEPDQASVPLVNVSGRA